MIVSDIDPLCKDAEVYYYDILCDEGHKSVPASVVEHVNHCQNCQKQLKGLKATLFQASGADSAIAVILQLHLAHIGRSVTCETVKPFLPTLLNTALRVRVPTPITVHLDNCRMCSEDLKTIQRMNLNRKQLSHLSQLFSDDRTEDTASCSEVQASGLSVASIALGKANAAVLRHLCVCRDCRRALYQYRENLRDGLLREGKVQSKFSCEQVSATDIFDYCVPYGIDPGADEYGKFREPLAEHIRSCPACLANIQQLHNTVYGIAERADSDVVTIYHIDESAKVQTPTESEDLYAGFPIRVEVAGSEDGTTVEPPASTIDSTAALRRKVSMKDLKALIKPAVAAAAVILIAVALFFGTPPAKGVTIKQVFKAIGKIKNVYIAKSASDRLKPTQELWVSRELSIYVTKTEKETVLWDIGSRIRRVKHTNTGAVETTPLTEEELASIEGRISSYLGLVPFADISDIPPDAQWGRITGKGLDASMEGTEVYDLVWIKKAYDGSGVFKKWRVFVEPKTNRLHRTEWYQKLTADEEYTLLSVKMIEYLDTSEMQTVLKKVSF